MKRVAPLDLIPYEKEKVQKFLEERFGWQNYKNKHYENIFTRFYEGYYLPHKFGYDKRRCYLSNLILTSGLSREEALKELTTDPYPQEMVQEDMKYIADKLGLSLEEFKKLIDGENKTYKHYRNSYKFIKFATFVLKKIGKEKRNFR